MAKIAIVYGSTTNDTARVAIKICLQPGFEDSTIFNIEDIELSKLTLYDLVILGVSTWDYGEVQSSWLDVWDSIDTLNLQNKIFAIFGLGDQFGYSQWFVDAMGILYNKFKDQGAVFIGEWPIDKYKFSSKISLNKNNMFVGLAIDEVNQPDLTDERIQEWCKILMND